jgi:hypothetical protein
MRDDPQRILNISAYDRYRDVLIESGRTRIALSIYEAEV